VYQFICTEEKAPGNSEVQRSISGPSVRNFMSVSWHLKFECGAQIFAKFVDSWNRLHMHTKIYSQNLDENPSENLDIDGRITLRLILKRNKI
jgi:hypothetical protein